MALPKIELPAYEFTIPSTEKIIRVRPFTVREEKLLLLAIESKVSSEVIVTVKQIINNCILDGDIDVDKMPFFDIDYLFVFLRAKSIGETVEVKLTCNNVVDDKKCGNEFMADMDIGKIELIKDDELNNDIKLNATSGVRMRYPNYSVMRKLEDLPDIDKKTHIIASSIDYIYDKSGMHSYKDYTLEELKAFVEDLTEENYGKLEKYVDNFPTIAAKINATCTKCGFEHKMRYTDFLDFFI